MNISSRIYYIVSARHDYAISTYLEGFGQEIAHLITQIHIEKLLELTELPAGIYIFSDLERFSTAQIHILSHICEIMEKSGGAYRILNHPSRALRRYELLRSLSDGGHNDYRAYRLHEIPEEISKPLFLRMRREHTGALTEPTTDRGLLDEMIAAILMHGIYPDDLLAVEFCDTRGPDGLFRKYAAHRIGDRIISRHLIIGEAWEIKFEARLLEPELLAEEMVYLEENPHKAEIERLFDLAKIDCGRIDYSLLDGEIQTWEINTNPMIVLSPASYASSRKQANRIVLDQIKHAFEEIAAEQLTGDTVRIHNLGIPVERICTEMT
jgi:hypothetical protein